MDKYKDNALVEEMDAIILLNDNYIEYGLKKGAVGVVMDNLIEEFGIIIAEFFNPFTGDDIQSAIEIKKEDFRVLSGSLNDRRLVKEYKDSFRK